MPFGEYPSDIKKLSVSIDYIEGEIRNFVLRPEIQETDVTRSPIRDTVL